MNIVIKSAIVALLSAAASSVNADCIGDGNNAAELIISQHWCSSPFPRGIPASEEGCRELAIQTCQSEDTFRSIINEWDCKQPKTSDIRYLGDMCEDTVDHLISITWPDLDDDSSAFVETTSRFDPGWDNEQCSRYKSRYFCEKIGCNWTGSKCISMNYGQSEAQADETSFVESTSRDTISWCDDRPDFFQRRFDDCVREKIHRDCLSWVGCCGGSIGGTACRRSAEEEASFVAVDSSTSEDVCIVSSHCPGSQVCIYGSCHRSGLEDYEASFVSKASKTRKPTHSPTRSPASNSSAASGFRAGQQAMQQWWKDEGSTCSNAWSGIINPVANEIKNSQFPNKGSSTRRARNQGARLGVDSEARSIQEKCFSANADMDAEEANEASFVSVERPGFPFPDPPRPWEICHTLRTKEECESEDWCTWEEFEFNGVALTGSCYIG